MMSKYFFKLAFAFIAVLAVFFLFSYANKTSFSNMLNHSACNEEPRSNEEGAVKGDLFFWESITRNFASFR